MTQLKDGGRQPRNREERSLSASAVVVRRQDNGWDEPCKSRGLRTVLWAAGGEIPPADPAMSDLRAAVSYRAMEWIRWTRPVPRSHRFEDAECDDATGTETMAAGVGWNVPATA